MKDIKWEDGAVCFANGLQHIANGFLDDVLLAHSLTFADFQLNEIRQGDCIGVSELDTIKDYENVLDVFDLFGSPRYENASFEDTLLSRWLVVDKEGDLIGVDYLVSDCKRLITLQQLMAIGKLKRAMIERDEALIDADENTSILKVTLGPTKDYTLAGTLEGESTKESRAYNILESMDIFYDEEKEKWYKKGYL